MNTREYFSQCFKAEKDKFIRVLKAVPADKTGYKPHERSTCAGDLVWLIASEWGDARDLIDHGKVDYVLRPAPAKVADSVAAFEKNADAIEGRLAKLDDAAWEKKAQFLMDGTLAWEAPLQRRCCRKRARCRLCLCSFPIRSAPASSIVWRGRAAMPPASSGSNTG